MNEKMKDYRFRMIYELEELVDRISKLQKYILVDVPGGDNTFLEQKQLDAMVAYREVLEERIYHEMIKGDDHLKVTIKNPTGISFGTDRVFAINDSGMISNETKI